MIYVLDIETEPNEKFRTYMENKVKAPSNYKDEAKINSYVEIKKKEMHKNMATSIFYSKINMIGIKQIGDNSCGMIVSLEELSYLFRDDPDFKIVTFNGKKFDVPIIVFEGIRAGLDMPYVKLMECCKRFRNNDHVDLMENICFGDYMSLDDLGHLFCGTKKKEIDFETASFDELKEHCLMDLEITENLYLMFEKCFSFNI